MAQLCLPLLTTATDVVVPSLRPLHRRRRIPCVHQQLVFAFPYQPPPQPPRKRWRQRPEHPQAAVHRLALAHVDLADKIAGNFARRTSHPFDDLRQLAVIGLLKAAARFDGTGGRSFRPYARTYANGEITHYLRDHGFAIKVPPSWRDLYASGQKLLREGLPPDAVPHRLGITAERWREIQDACSITVIALQPDT
ncbi:RNA polymerase subunit sigma-70 [Synechococcus sp. J7-Johnson]|uniref:sigma-70 family RNA polymerase sigma factor n=1 Tax=Synechococcus sp. J7-Johnson TaxID=2823737 RepID=UPI0020CC0078|nr:sigma factor [Synechococcus sp. J7-Johnson]MCP9841398.1 RNA polymerase subunit sigma-70 [Synechococcus sp. J7-Johnson]